MTQAEFGLTYNTYHKQSWLAEGKGPGLLVSLSSGGTDRLQRKKKEHKETKEKPCSSQYFQPRWPALLSQRFFFTFSCAD